ncbi:MAG TPA: hypothetical protein PKC38_08520 [Chitinophagales bacterium]|nr:hypothetical protein [Chitinophagales bacterium]
MISLRFLCLFSLIYLAKGLSSQNIDGFFQGYYYETQWEFTLVSTGHYKWETHGHFGFVTERGYYERHGDTLLLYKWLDEEMFDRDQTIDHILYVYSDSCLVDLNNKFDYCIIPNDQLWLSSKKRYLEYPQIPATDSLEIQRTAKLLQMAMEWEPACELFSCDTTSTEPLYILDYFELYHNHQPAIMCHNRHVVFINDSLSATIPSQEILTIRDINFTPYGVRIELFNDAKNISAYIVIGINPTNGQYIIREKDSSIWP